MTAAPHAPLTAPLTEESAVELLREIVAIPSVSCQEAPVAERLVERMTELGMDAYVDAVGNSIGTIGEGPLEVVLLGHQDTVPGDIPVRIEDGKLYGRGAVDAKGPLVTFVAATARLFQRIPDLPLKVHVIGCVEEEVPSSRGARFVRDQFQPDFTIIGEPSGWDGITLGYKGYMRATLHLQGTCSHTAHQAATMAERACELWNEVHRSTERFNEGRDKIFDQLFTRLVEIRSGTDGRYDWAELALNIRLPLDLPPDRAELWLREHVAEGDVTVQGHMPAWAGPRTTPVHRALGRAITRAGGRPVYKHKTGTADLNIVAPAWKCPALAYGPGDAALDHTPNEHIEVAEYLRGVEVLEAALEESVTLFANSAGGKTAEPARG